MNKFLTAAEVMEWEEDDRKPIDSWEEGLSVILYNATLIDHNSKFSIGLDSKNSLYLMPYGSALYLEDETDLEKVRVKLIELGFVVKENNRGYTVSVPYDIS